MALAANVMPPMPRYERKGKCLQCGWCCKHEDCEHFKDNMCLIHDDPDRPEKCKLFPAAPPVLHEGCGYYFLDKWNNDKIVKKVV